MCAMDIVILLLSTFGFAAAIFIPLLNGHDIAVERLAVPTTLQVNGFTEAVVTDTLLDELRRINASAATELGAIDLNKNRADESLQELQDYFGVHDIVLGLKTALGEIEHHIEGEVTAQGSQIVITTRLTTFGDLNAHGEQIIHIAKTTGHLSEVFDMLHTHAVSILDVLSPYVVAVHFYEEELASGEYGFPRARAQLDRFMQRAQLEEHYLGYYLNGRIQRIRAEQDSTLTAQERREALLASVKWMNAALAQKPEFFYPHRTLGMVYADLGDFNSADAHFARAVELAPNDLTTRERWARTLAEQGRVRDAVFQYVAAVELDPGDPELRHALAELYVKAGRTDAAQVQWAAAMRLAPMNETYPDRLRSIDDPMP
jgi:tetratricopeptide (TPR) repeat protein